MPIPSPPIIPQGLQLGTDLTGIDLAALLGKLSGNNGTEPAKAVEGTTE